MCLIGFLVPETSLLSRRSGLSARDIARRISRINVIIVSPDEWANESTDEFPVVEVGPLGEEVIILSSQQVKPRTAVISPVACSFRLCHKGPNFSTLA